MPDERVKRRDAADDPPRSRRLPSAAGQPSPEEVGSTAGRTHDQVLDATLPHDEAQAAKLRRDRSGLR